MLIRPPRVLAYVIFASMWSQLFLHFFVVVNFSTKVIGESWFFFVCERVRMQISHTNLCVSEWDPFKFQAVSGCCMNSFYFVFCWSMSAVPIHIHCMEENSLDILQNFSILVLGKQYSHTHLEQRDLYCKYENILLEAPFGWQTDGTLWRSSNLFKKRSSWYGT